MSQFLCFQGWDGLISPISTFSLWCKFLSLISWLETQNLMWPVLNTPTLRPVDYSTILSEWVLFCTSQLVSLWISICPPAGSECCCPARDKENCRNQEGQLEKRSPGSVNQIKLQTSQIFSTVNAQKLEIKAHLSKKLQTGTNSRHNSSVIKIKLKISLHWSCVTVNIYWGNLKTREADHSSGSVPTWLWLS